MKLADQKYPLIDTFLLVAAILWFVSVVISVLV